jgi:hypothetical protein
MNNYILLQAYGSKEIFDECRFFLMRFAATATNWEKDNINIVIYTNNQTVFDKWIPVLPNIIFVPITMEQVTEWRGSINFVHRVKIEIITHFFSLYNGNMLYCDTDTYPIQSLQPLFESIDDDKIYMHTSEGKIVDMPQFKKWYNFLQKSNLPFFNKSVVNTTMWNAGVIGINHQCKDILPAVLKLTDDVYPLFKKHTVEQFAFSYSLLQLKNIAAADMYIYHYWNLKELRILLNSWFLKNKETPIKSLIKSSQTISPQQISVEKFSFLNKPKIFQLYKKLKGKNWNIENYLPR